MGDSRCGHCVIVLVLARVAVLRVGTQLSKEAALVSFLTTPPMASFHRVSKIEVSPRLLAVVRQLDGILEAGAVPETPSPGPSALCSSSPSLWFCLLLPVPSPGVPEFWERKPEQRPQADARPWAPAGRKR